MKNTAKRLILFFVAVPVLVSLILFVPHYGHAVIVFLVIVTGILGTRETRELMKSAGHPLPRWIAAGGGILPGFAWLSGMGFLPGYAPEILLTGFLGWSFLEPAFRKNIDDSRRIGRTGAWLIAILYPGWFFAWIVRLAFLPGSSVVLLLFMLTVYLNDSSAWLFGKWLGKRRGIIPVSPNKSVEGFIGGLIVSVAVVLTGGFLYPAALPLSTISLIGLGLAAGIASIAGDLVESSIKRSAGVKDSGNMILGRGGILDSVDSLLLTAPIFWVFLVRL